MKKNKCFADRKDGTYHALIHKNCEGCRFYFPRKDLVDNPFYEYSYTNHYRMGLIKKRKQIVERLVMKKDD